MLIFQAKDIPPDLYDYFEPIESSPPSTLSPSPEPFPGQHFAVYPTGLIEPLIRATCPARCCPECGQGWSPVVEKTKGYNPIDRPKGQGQGGYGTNTSTLSISGGSTGWQERGAKTNILGYRPTCGCGRDDWIPGVCIDPFFGAGTTGLVCDRLGLNCIGIDISEKYVVDLAVPRIREDAPLLADVVVEGI